VLVSKLFIRVKGSVLFGAISFVGESVTPCMYSHRNNSIFLYVFDLLYCVYCFYYCYYAGLVMSNTLSGQ
jgi:hypothetical protein